MLILGLFTTVGVVLLDAHSRIAAEIASAMDLGHDLAATALRNVVDAGGPAAAFERLRHDLPRVRHVQFEVVPSEEAMVHGIRLRGKEAWLHPQPWLAQLLAPPPAEQSFPVVIHGERVGELRLRSNPENEIAEIVGEVELFASVLVALYVVIIGGILWTVRRALRPMQSLADGFDCLERGDYRLIAPIPVAELQRIGHQFNRLAQSLHRVTSDNHFLIGKLLSMQDEERKELAADLHDEFGPVLFGIRAEAACLMKSVARDTESYARAKSIAELTDGIQKVNYRMLDSLRPLILEQMGLSQTLRQLVASWQVRYPHITWSLYVPRDFEDPVEPLSLTLYRAVQESATNAVRHAQASAIDVRLERQPASEVATTTGGPAACKVFLSVQDNGTGLPENFRHGFGLLGMTERVRQLGGTLMIKNMQLGVAVEVTVPEETATSCHGASTCGSC